MYKTPELPGALRPLDPIRYELGRASAPSQLIFPLSNLVPPPPPTGVLVGGGGEPPRPQINLNHGLFSIPLFPYK